MGKRSNKEVYFQTKGTNFSFLFFFLLENPCSKVKPEPMSWGSKKSTKEAKANLKKKQIKNFVSIESGKQIHL